MELFLIIISIILLLGLAVLSWQMFGLKRGKDKIQDSALLMLQNQINEMNRTLGGGLAESKQTMQQQFGQTHQIVRDVTERLTKLDETNKQVMGFAQQLQSLENILKNPKQRGVLGEYYLETLLKNAFQPHQYQMQYKFNDGTIVDAVLFFGDKIISIDSKFSLENYNRIVEETDPTERERLEKVFKQDLKNRIDETAKYVRPKEGTMDFAFMFIPAEAIYYDLLINKIGAVKVNTRDLIDYAIKEKKVHIVSPTTFYVTLQALIQGMRAYQIQESTKEIIKNIIQLSKHLNSYQEYLKKLGGNLATTVNMYNQTYKEFNKIDKDIIKVTGKNKEVDLLQLEKPEIE